MEYPISSEVPLGNLKCYQDFKIVGLVAQSVMSATGMLGHRDVCVLSATDPHPRQWVCVCTMPNDVGMLP